MFQRWCEFTDSTALSRADYDPKQEVLRIEFRNGSVWDYDNVPAPIYGLLTSMPSAGRSYNKLVRNKYEGHRVNAT